jgi:hypothetical protein
MIVPGDYDQRLAWRVRECAENAVGAALMLFERWDPPTLDHAVELVCIDHRPSSETFDAIADAWERYRHQRHLPWD